MGRKKGQPKNLDQNVERVSLPNLQSSSKLGSCQSPTLPLSNGGTRAMKTELVNESRLIMEVALQDIKESLHIKVDSLSTKLLDLFNTNDDLTHRRVHPKKSSRKQHLPRDSLLSTMLDDQHDENYRTIFNIVLCVLFLWGLCLGFEDYTLSGIPNWELLTWGIFRDIGPFFIGWFQMFLSSFLIIFLAHFAAESANQITFAVLTLVYIAFQLFAFWYSAYTVTSSSIRFAMPLAIGLMAEQARMSMKMHSYYREKILWKLYDGKYSVAPVSSGRLPLLGTALPDFEYLVQEVYKFLYFHFVPTLVYRNKYPRTTRIKWQNVLLWSCQAFAIVYYAFLIFRAVLPTFRSNYQHKILLHDFVRATFSCMGPAMACMILTHFLVLHVVQNIGAEITQFADREFYSDWWNSRTFSVFYRKWNGVVHDFIHQYVFADLVEFARVPKLVALLTSFILSAVVHEYLICLSMGFFLPILGLLFTGPGLIFILLTKNKTGRIWNIFMWLMLSTGNAFLMVLYIREYFARVHNVGALTSEQILAMKPDMNLWLHSDYHGMFLNVYDFMIPRTWRIQYYS